MTANKLLMEMGIAPDSTGYYFLVEAINMRKEMVLNYKVTHKFMELYDVIGKKFDSKPSNVERAMRYAIEKAFEINNDTLSKTFGSMVDKNSGKVTVSCFIGTLAELLIEEG